MKIKMTSNCAVKIAVRECPSRANNTGKSQGSVIKYVPETPNAIVVDERLFMFDHVLDATVNQEQLFEQLIRPLVAKVKSGFNCTALAYGQTGTGKSYAMGLTGESCKESEVGIAMRCLRELFNNNVEESLNMRTIHKIDLAVSFIEIYNERVYDLLSEDCTQPILARGRKFKGSTQRVLSKLSDCTNIFKLGCKHRHVRPTIMNSQSSRSHAIFTIHVRNIIGECATKAQLNLVDLAGSEGLRRTGHEGMAMSEGVTINKGLLAISNVIHALVAGQKLIPYRDSVVSSVLQDSLNSRAYLTLLACVSSHRQDLSETLSTLRFAHNAKHLKMSPTINSYRSKNQTDKQANSTMFKELNSDFSLKNTDLQRRTDSQTFLENVSLASDFENLTNIFTSTKCQSRIFQDMNNEVLRRSERLRNYNTNFKENVMHKVKEQKVKEIAEKKHDSFEKLINMLTNKKFKQVQHRKAVLDLFNNGTIQELQKLPCVGEKTAYQILLHRTALGRFKSLEDVEHLPFWRGAAWQRFATVA